MCMDARYSLSGDGRVCRSRDHQQPVGISRIEFGFNYFFKLLSASGDQRTVNWGSSICMVEIDCTMIAVLVSPELLFSCGPLWRGGQLPAATDRVAALGCSGHAPSGHSRARDVFFPGRGTSYRLLKSGGLRCHQREHELQGVACRSGAGRRCRARHRVGRTKQL